MIITNFIARWIVGISAKITPKTVGVTIWPFIFVSPEFFQYDSLLIKHEQVHLKQWKRYWIIGFPFVYIWFHVKHGYKNNPLEIEARGLVK